MNQYISPQDIKVFLSYLDKPLLLPKTSDKGDLEGSPYIRTIVTEILYRRQDLHLILDTLRLIDSVSPALKVIEHRFILNTQGYRDEYLDTDNEDKSESGDDAERDLEVSMGSGSDSDSDNRSDVSEDLMVAWQPKSLAQRVLGIFSTQRPKKRLDFMGVGSDDDSDIDDGGDQDDDGEDDDDDDDDDVVKDGNNTSRSGKEYGELDDEEVGGNGIIIDNGRRRQQRHSRNSESRLLGGHHEGGRRESMWSKGRRLANTRCGRHLILALVLLSGTLLLVVCMLVEMLHF